MSPRRSNPAARDAVLEAARAEFARAGLDGARVEDIARRAGVSKGAFYLHFATKDDAFHEILQRFLGVMEEHAHRRAEEEQRFAREAGGAPSFEQALELECALDTELLEVLWRNRLILAALDRAAGRRDVETVSDFRRRMRALVTGRVALKQQQGVLRGDVPADVIGDVIMGAYESFGRRMVELREKPSLGAWARGLLTTLYQGALDRRPVAPPARAGGPRTR